MLFNFQFDDIQRAYQLSMASLTAAENGAEATVRKMYQLSPDEPFPEVEYDPETGESSMDWGELVGEIAHEAASSRVLVQTAFVIALFHFWERETNAWQGLIGSTYKHSPTMRWIQLQGGTPSDLKLRDLELAANCAKHGLGRSCIELYPRRPDLYGHTHVDLTYSPIYTDLVFTDQAIEDFFSAVRSSGPTLGNPFV